MSFDAFADAVQSEVLRELVTHWNEARGARRMPGWSDIRPAQIKHVLPQVWAWKYDRDSDRFSGRLVGDRIHRLFGDTNSGRPIEECFPRTYLAVIVPMFKRVVTAPEFYREEGAIYAHLGSACLGERIALPLAEDGVNADGIIGASHFVIERPLTADEIALSNATEAWYALG